MTPEQQAAAYANGSVAVTAGAGTGKTYMLAERYLYYLREQEVSPLEIVAVTFTDKAATELRSRIRALVAKQLPHRSDFLVELEAAPIGTFHSLARRICSEHPDAGGVPHDFRILDEQEGQLWLADCFKTALAKLPRRLYSRIPYSLMSAALKRLLADPLAAERALRQGTQHWEDLAAQLREQALKALLDHPTWQEAWETLQTYAGEAGDRLEEHRQIAVSAMAALAQGEQRQASLEAIDSIKLNVGSKKKWASGALDVVKDTLKRLRALVKKALATGLITIELSSADDQLVQMLPDLREAYHFVSETINAIKRRARVLTFADLEVHALAALNHSHVQSYYQQRYRAFLVDEFQDTNSTQAEFLQLLTHNAQLTIVGDPKQSIYGFRRADVSIFEQFRNRIQSWGGEAVALNQSFRTHHPLLEQINGVFAPVLGELHQELVAHRRDAPASAPHLQVCTVPAADEVNKPQRQWVEAHYIAQSLKEMLDSQTLVYCKRTDQLRPIRPQDIAILSRTWEPLERYGEALAAAGIPVAPAGGGNLLATREAKDAWALLRFLADPKDDLALVAVLRSPFFAWSDRELFELAGEREYWWQQLQTSEHPEIARAKAILSQLLEKRKAEPPTRLLQLADRLTGYTAVIANLPGAKRREADWRGFRELVRRLEQGGGDLFGVVRRLKRLVEEAVTVPRSPVEAGDAVSLMTIHSAKGLEWSVVVVADLTRSINNRPKTAYFDPEHGAALRWEGESGEMQTPVLYTWLEQQQLQAQRKEALRVLYVALTRARDRLLLTAADEQGGRLEQLRLGWEALGIPIEEIPYETEATLPPAPPLPSLPDSSPPRLLDSVGSGVSELPVTALSEYAQCPKRFWFNYIEAHPGLGEGVATQTQIGYLTHIALENGIPDLDTLARYADNHLKRECLEQALNLAQRFEEVPAFAPFRESTTATEKAVTLRIGQLTFRGIADIVGDGWVLDFKTDQAVAPQHHRFQLWAYAQALESPQAYIAYLRHDYLHSFSAAELNAAGEEAPSLVQGIVNGDYSAVPSQENCFYCPYAQVCDSSYQSR
jgi:ATP-dependent helicase/nuclease subunit A